VLQKEDFKQMATINALLRAAKTNVPDAAGQIRGKKRSGQLQ